MAITTQSYFQPISTSLIELSPKIIIKFGCKTSNKLDFNSNEGNNKLIAFLVPLLIPDSFKDFLLLFPGQFWVKFGIKPFEDFPKPRQT